MGRFARRHWVLGLCIFLFLAYQIESKEQVVVETCLVVRVHWQGVVLEIPGSLLGEMAAGSGHDCDGQRYASAFVPYLDFLYPSFKPIPAGRIAEFRVRSPGMHPDLVHVVILPPDEQTARVQAFLSAPVMKILQPLRPGPFGLQTLPVKSFVAYLGTPARLSINCFEDGPISRGWCSGTTYVHNNIEVDVVFSYDVFPHWADVMERTVNLVQSFIREDKQ